MQVLVIYDISHDGTRTKVADCCLDYGLDRIQYSAFTGQLSRTHQEELALRIKRRVSKRAAKVYMVPISADDWARRVVLEQEEVKAKVKAEVKAEVRAEPG
ncbi:MAG: CRISPR-associated endonuclease Cas2 [Chloroflexi bacterium HGW-Chloroflexi-1]|nr:MAG: CRISPR-associated endonuclease Cas2 [Chloroflexi bacterium HGW-Chloroflexi-1]